MAGAAAAGRRVSGPVMGATARGARVVAVPVPPSHRDCAGRAPDAAPGSAGKAGEEVAGDEVLAGAVHVVPGTARTAGAGPVEDEMLAALPRRVLLFSFKTRVVCRCEAGVGFAVGDAATADAQPLVEVVAPCMPPRPGSDG